jgi:hypothetical protein
VIRGRPYSGLALVAKQLTEGTWTTAPASPARPAAAPLPSGRCLATLELVCGRHSGGPGVALVVDQAATPE